MTSPENIKRGLAAFDQAKQLHAQKKMAEAAAAFQRATALMPDHPELLNTYSLFAEEVGDYRASEIMNRRLAELRPGAGYEGRLAIILFRQKKFAEAVPFYEQFLQQEKQRKSPSPDILHGFANALCSIGRWEDGLEQARRALAIREDVRYRDAEFNALYHLGRTEELDARLGDMLARYPDSKELRSLFGLHKLKSGEFSEGFRYFADIRWRNTLNYKSGRGSVDNYSTEWDGKVFDGVLIITAEQGIGDEIMLSSMFEDLIATGQHVVIECDARLIPLYQRSCPGLAFLPRNREKTLNFPPGTDVRSITALDLANVLRNGIERFPAQRRSWLKPDPERVAALRQKYRKKWPGKRLVGLSWKSARSMEGGETKNINITDFAGLIANRETVFINLQYGNIAADLAALRGAGLTLHVDEEIDTMNDIDGFAAQVAALDLVISTSNTTVHVAGGLGVPCWLLLPHTRPILWYWGYRGERNPWYPSLKIRRNPREGDWTDLFRKLEEELAELDMPGNSA